MPQPKQEFTARQPDYQVSALEKSTGQKGTIGSAWSQPDGSIRIKLNAFVVLPTNTDDLVITCWPNNGNSRPSEEQRQSLRQGSASLRKAGERYKPKEEELDLIDDSDIPF